jgi:PAS domain-containing protein
LLDMLSRAGMGQETRGLWRHQKKDGTIVHVEISARGLIMGGRRACLIHARDVSARVAAERTVQETLATLRQSQILARIASAAARMGGWAVDLNENTLTWSDEVCVLHDVPPGHRPDDGRGHRVLRPGAPRGHQPGGDRVCVVGHALRPRARDRLGQAAALLGPGDRRGRARQRRTAS